MGERGDRFEVFVNLRCYLGVARVIYVSLYASLRRPDDEVQVTHRASWMSHDRSGGKSVTTETSFLSVDTSWTREVYGMRYRTTPLEINPRVPTPNGSSSILAIFPRYRVVVGIRMKETEFCTARANRG